MLKFVRYERTNPFTEFTIGSYFVDVRWFAVVTMPRISSYGIFFPISFWFNTTKSGILSVSPSFTNRFFQHLLSLHLRFPHIHTTASASNLQSKSNVHLSDEQPQRKFYLIPIWHFMNTHYIIDAIYHIKIIAISCHECDKMGKKAAVEHAKSFKKLFIKIGPSLLFCWLCNKKHCRHRSWLTHIHHRYIAWKIWSNTRQAALYKTNYMYGYVR